MKIYTDGELNEFLNGLNEGKTYCGILNGHGEGVIYKTNYNNIGWRHYGESANRFTIPELRFVLETIFKDCDCITEAKYDSDYLNYVPIDSNFKGINCNRHAKENAEYAW